VRLGPSGAALGTLYFVIQQVVPPPGGRPWARGLDLQTIATIAY